jgi:RNA polymerase sigma-70 factor (ECF subfamily)
MEPADVMLVLLAQQGDRDALNKLLERVQDRLFRYVSRLLNNSAVAEDVLQEALLRIARKIGYLDEPKMFETWAYRIASREVFRMAKHSRTAAATEGLELDVAAPEVAPPRMTWDELGRLTGELSPECRAVMALHYGEDRPLKEVAEILDVPLGTVKSRLGYGLTRLRGMLARP